jgi:hypothetical protein
MNMQGKLSTLFRDNNRLAVAVFILIILAPFGYSLVQPVFTQGSSVDGVFLDIPDEGECVRETAYMRFHHMDLLKQTREDVIRAGIRGDITLSGCRECHTYREQFCNRCHDAVTLSVDCFGCHYYPESVADSLRIEGEGHDG